MTWQRRLAEMVLAGGTIAAAGACSTSNSSSGVNFCCNANGDPCCAYKNCGGALTPECSCQMEGGAWNPYASYNDAGQLVGACQAAGDTGAPDAREAGGSDGQASD